MPENMQATQPAKTADITYMECPHCYVNVMFRADGICLNCRKNRFDTQSLNPDQTLVNIDHNHRLPSCCFLCGEETPLTKKLSWSFYSGPNGSLLARIASYVPGSQHRATHRITMPVCLRCTPLAKRVRPLSVMHGLSCRVLVHRNFRNRFEKLNGKEYLEWECDVRIDNAHGTSIANPGKNLFRN